MVVLEASHCVLGRVYTLTLRDFLVESAWSEGDILALGLIGLGMGGYGALINMGFLELFRLELLGAGNDLYEIAGGADQLPFALLSAPSRGGQTAPSKGQCAMARGYGRFTSRLTRSTSWSTPLRAPRRLPRTMPCSPCPSR